MRISVIIPTIKPEAEIAALVAEINATMTYDFDLIIVAHPDKSAAENQNIGMNQVKNEFIILCGDDVEQFGPGWDKGLIDCLISTKASMVGPRLYNPDGTMQAVNYANYDMSTDYVQVSTMITAICAYRNTPLRFDENFKGSGFDDTDFCKQLGGTFFVANTVKVVHRNEKKNQFNEYNRDYFNSKWSKYMGQTCIINGKRVNSGNIKPTS